jgi:hypothetical protein
MAIAQHLPVYKLVRDLAQLVADLIKDWRKDFRRALGERALDECFQLAILIFRANVASGQERVAFIQQAREGLQVIELALRLAADLRLITPEQHGRTIQLTDNIGRQATGWKNNAAASPAA